MGQHVGQSVTALPFEDASFTLTATCAGATTVIAGDVGGAFAFNPVPTDGATIDAATGLVTGVSGTNYTVEYTTGGPCAETTSETVTVFSSEDASFTFTPNCTGATASITGDTGGTFTFNSIQWALMFGNTEGLYDLDNKHYWGYPRQRPAARDA